MLPLRQQEVLAFEVDFYLDILRLLHLPLFTSHVLKPTCHAIPPLQSPLAREASLRYHLNCVGRFSTMYLLILVSIKRCASAPSAVSFTVSKHISLIKKIP